MGLASSQILSDQSSPLCSCALLPSYVHLPNSKQTYSTAKCTPQPSVRGLSDIVNRGVFKLVSFYAAFRGLLKKQLSHWTRAGIVPSDDQKNALVRRLSALTPNNTGLHEYLYNGIFKADGGVRAKCMQHLPGNALKEEDETFVLLRRICEGVSFRDKKGCPTQGGLLQILRYVHYCRVIAHTPARIIAFPPSLDTPPLEPVPGNMQLWSMYGQWVYRSCTTPGLKGFHPDKYEFIRKKHELSLLQDARWNYDLESMQPITRDTPLTPKMVAEKCGTSAFNSLVITTDFAGLTSEVFVSVSPDDIIIAGGGARLDGVCVDYLAVHSLLKNSRSFRKHISANFFPLHKFGHILCEVRQWIKTRKENQMKVLVMKLGAPKRTLSNTCELKRERTERYSKYLEIIEYFLGDH